MQEQSGKESQTTIDDAIVVMKEFMTAKIDDVMGYMKKFMITREDLDEALGLQENKFDKKLDERFTSYDKKMDEKFAKNTHDILDHIDNKLLELKIELKGDIQALVQVLKEKGVVNQQEANALLHRHIAGQAV